MAKLVVLIELALLIGLFTSIDYDILLFEGLMLTELIAYAWSKRSSSDNESTFILFLVLATSWVKFSIVLVI